MAKIQLRDRWIPTPEVAKIGTIIEFKDTDNLEVTFKLCEYIINHDICSKYVLNKPRYWGKTVLATSLVNNFDNVILITDNIREEIRVRRDYNIKSPNKYNIYGFDNLSKLVGLEYDWVVFDDVSTSSFEEFKYYHGFRLKKYIRIGTF